MSYDKLPELPKYIPLDAWLGPSEELVALRKYKKRTNDFLKWLITNVLTDSQLDTRTECGETIRNFYRGMCIK